MVLRPGWGLAAVLGALLPLSRAGAEPVLVRALAFGAATIDCESANAPGVVYDTVVQSSPAAIEYSAARGWGYEVRDPGLSTYAKFGPIDDSPNLRGVFPSTCPGKLYNSFIGTKPVAPCVGVSPPCLPAEGITFRIDLPNGTYRFVAAVGDAQNRHVHRIVVEDGGSGLPTEIGPNHVVLVDNFDQAARTMPCFARVGFDGRLPPPIAGAIFVDMDEAGLETAGGASSPTLDVTRGYIRVHQLKGATSGTDGNGADLIVLEAWRVAERFTAIAPGSTWKYRPGQTEASSPDATAWRAPGFADASWASGAAPIGYAEAGIATDLSLIAPPMQGNYRCVFLRQAFALSQPSLVSQLVARTEYDDGFVVWINGVEVLRVNLPGLSGDPVSIGDLAVEGHENLLPEEFDLPDPAGYLVAGTNVVAAQVFNNSLTSSDLYFDVSIFDPVAPDLTPPAVLQAVPAQGATVRALGQIEVEFTEEVVGVDAADLLVEGTPALSVSGSAEGPYTFLLSAVPPGPVEVRWAVGHGIFDVAEFPNAFRGGSWVYTLDPDAVAGDLVLNEILALNGSTLDDEDGDSSDWIEIRNRGDRPVSLDGYSLTDDPDEPRLWTFPAVTLGAGQYLVVFASGKDRRDPSGELHASFELSSTGEYLGLFAPESPPAVVSELAPRYPPQKTDVSWGLDGSGSLSYLATPTPGAANSGTASYDGFVLDPACAPARGLYGQPVDVTIWSATPGATIRYTLDGSAPTATSGTVYSGPVRVAPGGGKGAVPLRAIAYRSGLLDSEVATHTYIFPASVVSQTSAPAGFPTSWNGQPADYGMDSRVTGDPGHADLVLRGLESLPTISIATRVDDLFGPSGIYANPSREGLAWERPASAEFIATDGRETVQVNCGIRIQGGTSTSGWKSIKLSMRLFFRGDYGTSRLRAAIFPDTRVDSFDTIVLDAHLNQTWNHPDHGQRVLAQYVRDCFTSDLQNSVGGYGPHDTYAHVYLDGVYWGLYDVHEKPDHAWAASYFGGDETQYDAVRHNLTDPTNIMNGDIAAWNEMFSWADGGLADNARYLAMQDRLDLPNFIDYMIVNLWAGNTDWAHQNWYSTRRRAEGGLIRYHSWDAEHVLKSVSENRVGADNAGGPTRLFQRLRANAEFRLLFADHVHRHFFNGGTFHVDPSSPAWDPARPERNRPADLYVRRIDEVDGYLRREVFGDETVGSGIACESARWGDAKSPADEYTRNNEWLAELNRLLTQYLPQRSGTVLSQLRTAGLYPAVGAPVFSQHGGRIDPGFRLAIARPTGTTGTIHYTTDGTDPRLFGTGAVSSRARPYSSPILLDDYSTVKARILSGTDWSALTEASFSLADPGDSLGITEISYDPPAGPQEEFIELQNFGDRTIGLSGAVFVEGISFVFPTPTTLGPGELLVLVSEPAAFAARYPGVRIDGTFQGTLSNGGERLTLLARDARPILSVEYDDEGLWPVGADGFGFTLVLTDPLAPPGRPESWRPSAEPGGSPGRVDPLAPPGGVYISEVLARPAAAFEDAIELVNLTASPRHLGGWYLSDSRETASALRKFRIPDGVVVPPGGHAVIYEAQLDALPGAPGSFALDPRGGAVYLTAADSSGALTGHIAEAAYGPEETGVSFGRTPTTVGFDFAALSSPTFGVDDPATVEEFREGTGAPNALPLAGPVAIHEILYHPASGQEEFIELRNVSGTAVALHDAAAGRGWRIEGLRDASGADSFEFPPGAAIPASGYLLVVSIDPGAFRTLHAVPAAVPILGPFGGQLDNGGETLSLRRPLRIDGGDPSFVLVERVRYDDADPWPDGPDGDGYSLERIDPDAYGNDPGNWGSSTRLGGTPGAANSIGGSGENRSPHAAFLASPISGKAPLQALLDASESFDSDGSIRSWLWDFGDGQVGSAASVTHVFRDPGTFTVVLVVTDDRGATATAWRSIVVDPPSGGGQVPGDATQDGTVDVADAVRLLLLLFQGVGAPPCSGDDLQAGGNRTLLDSNGDGSVNVSDPIHVLAWLFLGGPGISLGTDCVEIVGCPDVCR